MKKIDGGYVLINQKALLRLKAQISTRELTANEARGIIGFLEMRSIRNAAEALRSKNKKCSALIPNYSAKELSKLTNLPQKVASRVFKIAISSDLFSPEKGKIVPVPRRLIRFLAKCEKRSTILVLLAYLERGMSFDKGEIKNAGTIKASLIAEQTGLTLRSVRAARAELLELGILTPDTTIYQRKLNRDGAYFTINLSWRDEKVAEVINLKGSERAPKSPIVGEKVVDNLQAPKRQISSPPTKNSTKISPPYRNKISSYEYRNQKTQGTEPAGVCKQTFRKEKSPTIKDIQPEDLREFSRNEALYWQARNRGLISGSEADILNWISASIRARETQNPAKIFMGIIKKKLFHHITQAQEEQARMALNRRREKHFDAYRTPNEQRLAA